MTTTELLQFHENLTRECREIMAKKNHDYAGANGQTPFGNFQAPEQLGLCSTETGIVMRMLDKVKRLVTFCNAGELKVENEGAADACKDIVNYAIILAAYVKEKAAYRGTAVDLRSTGSTATERSGTESLQCTHTLRTWEYATAFVDNEVCSFCGKVTAHRPAQGLRPPYEQTR